MEQEKNTLTVLEIAPGHYPKHGVCPPEKRCIQGMILAQGLDILHLLHIEHHGIDIALAARVLL